MLIEVLLVFGFVLSCFRGALAEVSGSCNFASVPNTKIISDQIFLFLCLVFCFVFSENAYRGFFNSFFNSSSCVSAFLLFCGLGALFLRPASPCAFSFVFLHGVDSEAYLAAALWCCGFIVLWLWTLGPVVAHTFHSFPFFSSMQFISLCFFCLIVLSDSGSSSPLRGAVSSCFGCGLWVL